MIKSEKGYSLIEMITVMAIMGIVMAGLTQIFVAGSKAEVDMNNRFQAQLNGRLALDRLRRDVHCATDITPYSTSSVTLKLPTGCGGDRTYCTVAVGSSGTRFALYRQAGTTCGSTNGIKYVDYLTTAAVFPTYAHVAGCGCLASLAIDLPVSVKGGSVGLYDLKSTVYLRNSTRI